VAFIESPRFPEAISYGSRGGPMFNTQVIPVFSGKESRNKNWPFSLRKYDAAHAVKTQAQFDELLNFFEVVAEGKGTGFRFKDWSDFVVTVANGLLTAAGGAAGVGNGTPTYSTYKRYTSGALTKDRLLQKLVSGTVSYYRNGVLLVVGGGAGQIGFDINTGIVTFFADASVAITGHTVGASHIFTTATDPLGLVIGKKVYLSGLTVGGGTDVLNGLAHTISNKSGSGPYTWTISTTTTGRTVSGGTAYKYPQASDALTCAAEFDVPARLDTDHLDPVIDDGMIYSWDQIPIVELRDPT